MIRTVAPIFIAASLFGFACVARPVTYILPPENPPPPELAGADAAPVAANCATCHSLDYIVTQPRGKGAQFWRDEVTKMRNIYKAPIAPEDGDRIADILSKKFG